MIIVGREKGERPICHNLIAFKQKWQSNINIENMQENKLKIGSQ